MSGCISPPYRYRSGLYLGPNISVSPPSNSLGSHLNSIQVRLISKSMRLAFCRYPCPESCITTQSRSCLTSIQLLRLSFQPLLWHISPASWGLPVTPSMSCDLRNSQSMSHLTSKQVLKKFISTPTWSSPSMPRYLGLTSFHLPRFTCIRQPHPDHVSLPCRFSRSCNLHLNSIQVPSHINPGVDICISSPSRSLY